MIEMDVLFIDLETFSDIDLSKCGSYKYAESPSFEILLFGYSINGGPVKVIDLASGEEIPNDIISAITDETVTKWAFNASFERICLSNWIRKHYPRYFKGYGDSNDSVGKFLNPKSWKCSMVWSAYMGLPLSLAQAGAVLGLKEQKLTEGKELIRYFCTPCKPTKANGGRTRNYPFHDKEKWGRFKFYNQRDVEVEMSIHRKLEGFPVPEFVWDEYHRDQIINDRGIKVDMIVVNNAILIDSRTKEELTADAQRLTGLDNPNSVAQLTEWLLSKGIETESLDKNAVKKLLTSDIPEDIKRVLRIRQQLAKSSVKKYQAIDNAVCADGRVRGMFQFYGANRSGRWAGRLVQLQNLPQNHMEDLEFARAFVEDNDYEMLSTLYDSIPDTLSELIRTAFVPKKGYKFIVSDFSAIEARVLAWLADEEWRMKVFRENGDIYCASASEMFHKVVTKTNENKDLRQKGKIAELALGYGGAVGALKSMGALEKGVKEEELQPLVDSWRASNQNIVSFWWVVDAAVKSAVIKRIPCDVKGIWFEYKNKILFITLPSGRKLTYINPKPITNDYGTESISYGGLTANKKWDRIESYGPKFVENIIQAISRDILCYAMATLSDRYICGHVHDELIIECPLDTKVDEICTLMSRTPSWAKGLILNAAGYETMFYKKD